MDQDNQGQPTAYELELARCFAQALDGADAAALHDRRRVSGVFMARPVAALLRYVCALLDGGEPLAIEPPEWLREMLAAHAAQADGATERERLRDVGLWCALFLREHARRACAEVGLPELASESGTYVLPEPPFGFSSWLEVRAIASGSVFYFVRPPRNPRTVRDEYAPPLPSAPSAAGVLP